MYGFFLLALLDSYRGSLMPVLCSRLNRSNAMPKFNDNIRKLAKESTDFRREILTNQHSQVVLMSVQPGDDIGEETHDVDQVLVFVEGRGEAYLNGEKGIVEEGSLVAVPAGTLHNFVNTGTQPLKLY